MAHDKNTNVGYMAEVAAL